MMMKGSGSSDMRDSISSELMFWLGGKYTEQRVMVLEREILMATAWSLDLIGI
jgi:hypothetical protein